MSYININIYCIICTAVSYFSKKKEVWLPTDYFETSTYTYLQKENVKKMLFLKDDCWDIDKWWQFICLFSRRTAYQITSFCFIFFKCPWPPSIAHHCIQIISTSRSFHDLFRYVHMYIIIIFTTQNMSLQSLLYCRRKWNIF